MAGNASNLSSVPGQIYDIVVATTQSSINSTMKRFLKNMTGVERSVIIVGQGRNKPVLQYDLPAFKDKFKVDPFTVPAGADDSNDNFNKLKAAQFKGAFKLTLGLPNNYDPDKLDTIPDIISLTPPKTIVGYKMYCADIVVTEIAYDSDGALPYKRVAQSDARNRTWYASSNVNLDLTVIPKPDPGTPQFSLLPPDVQAAIRNLSGSMFDIGQLLFDLDNAGLSDLPNFDNKIDPTSDAAVMLNKYFVGAYFGTLKSKGAPALNYTIVQTPQLATLKPSSLNFGVSSPVDKNLPRKLYALEYLSSTTNKNAPQSLDLSWDWITAADTNIHGVIAIRRGTFRKYLEDEIVQQSKSYCFVPEVKNWLSGTFDTDINYSVKANYGGVTNNDMKVTEYDTISDNKLFSIHYNRKADAQSGAGGGMGAISLECDFTCDVSATGNKITVNSCLTVHLFVRALQNHNEADIVKKFYTDVIELNVDGTSTLKPKRTSTPTDKSATDTTNAFSNFFADVNSVFNSLNIKDYVGTKFGGERINGLDSFIFPGGKTFAFSTCHFSNNQDLICGITYANQ